MPGLTSHMESADGLMDEALNTVCRDEQMASGEKSFTAASNVRGLKRRSVI